MYSSTDFKKEDAFKLGADEFYTTKGVEKLELPGMAEGKRRNKLAYVHDERGTRYAPVLPSSSDGSTDHAVDGVGEGSDNSLRTVI